MLERVIGAALLLSLTACTGENAEDLYTAQIDEIFSEWDQPGSPGAAVAVIKDGEIIFAKGYGEAQVEYGVPITPDTVFHVASVSKQFTAFAIATLADQGVLSLDDDIRDHLPYVPDFGETITIRHLANHTSGLRDQWSSLALAGWRLDDVITLEHVQKIVSRQRELNFSPGELYSYSNTGFTLMGDIVTRVTGTPFPEWMHLNVFEPLGMTSTLFYYDHEAIVSNRAYSYNPTDDNSIKKAVLSYANVGATSLFTTVNDLSLWLDNYRTARVGGRAVIDAMLEEGMLNNGEGAGYSMGVVVDEFRGVTRISHSGGDAGFRSFAAFFPEHSLGINVLSNLGNLDPGGRSAEVAELFLGEYLQSIEEEQANEEPVEPVELSADILQDLAGTYQFPGDNGAVLNFSVNDGQFTVQGSQLPPSPLTPVSEASFYLARANVTFSFADSNTGKAVSLDQSFFGDEPALRIELPELDEDDLARFAGRYYSAELDTAYDIVLRDKSLVATHSRHSDINLFLIAPDRFSGDAWFFGDARFDRNDSGEPVVMLVSSGRFLNMRFEKQ